MKTEKSEYYRPFSASAKTFFKVPKESTKGIYPSLNQLNKTCEKPYPKNITEKEKLYEDNIQLKSFINNLMSENSFLRSEIHKLGLEQSRKIRTIEKINHDIQNCAVNGGQNEGKIYSKVKETYEVINLKKQVKEMKNDSKEITLLIEEKRKLLKNLKISDFNININKLSEELINVHSLYENSLKENMEKDSYLQKFAGVQELINTQQNDLTKISEGNRNKEMLLRDKELHIAKLKNLLKEKEGRINKLNKDIGIQKAIQTRKGKEAKEEDIKQINVKINELKQKEESLRDEVKVFKKDSDKKEARIKELDEIIKKGTENKNKRKMAKDPTNFKESIKYIQPNPEDRFDSKTLFLKSRILELKRDKELFDLKNKILIDKLQVVDPNFNENIEVYTDTKQVKEGASENTNQAKKESNKVSNNENIDEVEENKQIKEVKEENLNSNDDENYVFTKDQLNEFTYILIKNLEAMKIDSNKISKILDEISSTSEEIVLNDMAAKISETMNLKDPSDENKILIYINTILINVENDFDIFRDKFLSLFDSITKFTVKEEESYKNKLAKKLVKHKAKLEESIKSYDINNTGFITFSHLRKILDTIPTNLKDDEVEYMIYLMKLNIPENSFRLDDLKYSNVVSLINDESRVKNAEHEKSQSIKEEDEEESQLVINSDEYQKKIDEIISQIVIYLQKNNKTLKSLFSGKIYTQEVQPNLKFDAISLEDFVNELNKVKIRLDQIGLFCIFSTLKINDEIESIDFNKLVELVNGFNQSKGSTSKEANLIEEFFNSLGNFLLDRKMKLKDLLGSHIQTISINNEPNEVVQIKEFNELLIETGILKLVKLDNSIMELICDEKSQYIIISKLKSNLELRFKNKKKEKEKQVKPLKIDDQTNDLNDIPNADSKIFDESLNGDKVNDDGKDDIVIEKHHQKDLEDGYDFIEELSNEDSSVSKTNMRKETSNKKKRKNTG